MDHSSVPAKLLISILGRNKGEHFVAVSKAAGARGGTIALGRSVEGGAIMRALSLGDVQQDIVFTLMRDEAASVLAAVQENARKSPKKLSGMLILVDVTGMCIRSSNAQQCVATEMENKTMDSGFKVLTVIVNHGYADDVMAAARKAGATGGTILVARGTGTEEDVKFFGIALVPEKEMLLIVCESEKEAAIIKAVNETPHLCEPGGGIVYSQSAEKFIVLGK